MKSSSLLQRAGFSISLLLAFTLVSAYGQSVVSHWTFNTPSLTLDTNGNITGAADSTGNHNAVNTQTAGTGTGSPYSSTTIPGSASISGKFGQGLTLTGNNTVAGGGGNFLTFPNLRELMRANGAPSYTVSLWLNTTTVNAQQFTILGDWGNAGTSSTNRFSYGFGFQFTAGAAQMRAQTRTIAVGTGGNGSDIFALATNTPSLNDGSWHMVTWTFDTTAGVLKGYFDGGLQTTFQSAQALGFQLLDSASSIGTFGLKGDSGNFLNGTVSLDEVWVLNGRLDDNGVQALFNANVIPEPGSFVLFGLGALALGVRWRRKQAK